MQSVDVAYRSFTSLRMTANRNHVILSEAKDLYILSAKSTKEKSAKRFVSSLNFS